MIELEKVEDDEEVGFPYWHLVSDGGVLPEPYEHPLLVIDPITLERLSDF